MEPMVDAVRLTYMLAALNLENGPTNVRHCDPLRVADLCNFAHSGRTGGLAAADSVRRCDDHNRPRYPDLLECNGCGMGQKAAIAERSLQRLAQSSRKTPARTPRGRGPPDDAIASASI